MNARIEAVRSTIASRPGRVCPVDYRYDPSELDREPEIAADVLYVVGGLYGNAPALDTVERLVQAERGPVTLVFNGDFHWFDAEPAWFGEIERRVARHMATRGNVETEIARLDDVGAGCGCAYPEGVDDAMVTRSNEMLRQLRSTAIDGATPERLAVLPMHLVAAVGGLRIGIVHGDAAALAGWRFARETLDDPANRSWLADVRARSRIDVFASTHTCLAALRHFDLPCGGLTVINNGAAGMANFAGTQFGLISRIATRPSPHARVYGAVRDGVFIDALPVAYDTAALLDRFLARWPAGSLAHQSYFRRIVEGPDHAITAARPA
ncbi:MAG: metallophosphoesterase [Xanthobacteraceae bacterium]